MLPKNFPYRKTIKRDEGAVRQAAYDKLSVQEKIARLDRVFGTGLGAVKQRARLTKQLFQPKPVPAPEPETTEVVENTAKKSRSKNSAESKKSGRGKRTSD